MLRLELTDEEAFYVPSSPPSSPSLPDAVVAPHKEDDNNDDIEIVRVVAAPFLCRDWIIASVPSSSRSNSNSDGDKEEEEEEGGGGGPSQRQLLLSQPSQTSLKRTRSVSLRDPTRETPRAANDFWFELTNVELRTEYRELWRLEPPPAPSIGTVKDPSSYYARTEVIGQYLISRGFPLLAAGSNTLVFLLTETLVAKVAVWGLGASHDAVRRKHISDRNYDVVMSRDYPSCFAATRLLWVELEPATTRYVHWVGGFHRLYIQERLKHGSFIHYGHDPQMITRDANCHMITQMITNNLHEQFKQWGLTQRKRARTFTSDGVEEEWEREWLVCFDYE